ncbi:MAG TPA: DinB family protein [Chloroflexota bacterium]|nr:DinB family protein [Chloroflexota bacterium]
MTLGSDVEDLRYYVELKLEEMSEIVRELGDERANLRPQLPGANSPYVILTHCLGVLEYWAGQVVAGRRIARDRAAEFRAHGDVGALLDRVEAAKQQFRSDLTGIRLEAPLSDSPPDSYDLGRKTNGRVLMHVLEELAQHLGQMEITRDLLNRDGGSVA